ncbi:NACHT domain-containing protein [Actinomadura syzygii]|uniref:NACHT domain-containing protein n=1 Tax=Actinomadura syzygii TaxID=1427538 RepID=UPI00165260C2|nr:NACHT domain-containing protein [Actinomadura syzygii]
MTTTAAGGVVCAVTANQVLNDSKVSWNWAIVSLCVAAITAIYAELFSPEATGGSDVSGVGRGVGRRAYLRQIRGSVRDMETVGIATQSEFVLRMQQVYVDVSLVPRPPQDTDREPFIGAPAQRPGERRALRSFLGGSDRRVLAVIGGPGSGKTTLVRKTALELSSRNWRTLWRSEGRKSLYMSSRQYGFRRIFRRRTLPVLLYLRDHARMILTEDPPDLSAVAVSASWLAGRISPAWIQSRLDRGGCLILLDGLDEVADETERSRVARWIGDQIDRYPSNEYVLTSRPHGYQANPLPNANVLQVRRFTGKQVSRFLHSWYHAIERRATEAPGRELRAVADRKAEDLLDRLRRQPALYDLAANPLLLTMIANVHRYKGALPGSRAALYAEMCEVLLHRRQEAKQLSNPTGLSGDQKEHVVRAMAHTMMTQKIRDIPFTEACEAIAFPLRQVSPAALPDVFLSEINKSGLLVEREQGVYSFAHLTLQEYLASAHIRDSGRTEPLVSAVNDPWWRETTLLWVARADATEVIRACLDAGTTRALSLAFACADQARQVDPDTRGELDDLLTATATEHDPDRRRLITAVKAMQSLHEVILLSEDVPICAHPVGRDLYAEFVREEQAAGLHTPSQNGYGQDRASHDEAPVTGIWADDANRFVQWLNALFDDGTAYRLPVASEMTDPALDLISGLGHRPVWVLQDETRPGLFTPQRAPVRYAPLPNELTKQVAADFSSTSRYLPWALNAASGGNHVLALISTPDADDGETFDLTLRLALARTLIRSLNRANSSISILATELSARLRQSIALDIDPTYDQDRTTALEEVLPGLSANVARSLTYELDMRLAGRLRKLLRYHQPIARPAGNPFLTQALDRLLDQTLGLTADFSLEFDRSFNAALNRSELLAQFFTRLPNISSPFAPTRHAHLAEGVVHALQETQNLADEILEHRQTSIDLLNNNDVDGAINRIAALTGRAPEIRLSVAAYSSLLDVWTPNLSRQGKLFSDFHNFSVRTLSDTPSMAGRKHREPADVLGLARRTFIDDLPSNRHLQEDKAVRFIDMVRNYVDAVARRRQRCDRHTIACARLGVLAALALSQKLGNAQSTDLFAEAWHGLNVDQGGESQVHNNEVLLLVRT